jgi:Terminase RNaseH-like domain
MEALNGHAWVTMCTWQQVPHLSPQVQAELLSSYPDYQRDARSKGIPSLGSGAIYKVAESEITIDDIPIPAHWPRAYGFDVGWRWSAAVWGALDRDSDTLYVTSEHYRSESEPVIHAEAIKTRGAWIKGAIDPAARGRGQIDGRNLLDMYRDLGLDLVAAENSVETGIYELLMRMTSGRLKIFKSCQNLLAEYRLYRRDEKGRICKEKDHALDALRYMHGQFLAICATQPAPQKEKPVSAWASASSFSTGWMG